MPEPQNHINTMVDDLFRNEAGKISAILTRIFGFEHAALIEDIVQDTFISALKTWPAKGQPDNPAGWLMQVAKHKTINAVKRNQRLARDVHYDNGKAAPAIEELFLDHEIEDSQLRILFACCNPVLHQREQIALTLKTISGFSNAEIARALLMSEAAVKKMVYRARKSIRIRNYKLDVPFKKEAVTRLDTVRTVCYLLFNEGYKGTQGDREIRESLCREAIRLTELLSRMQQGAAESAALLALMLFNVARFPARVDDQGNAILLEEQDRSLWDEHLIRRGFHHMKKARSAATVSRYHLEAGIASVHCSAPRYADTDWHAIVNYYRYLIQLLDNPITRLNYAIAVSNLHGPEAGLKQLDESGLQAPLEEYFLLYAAKADMHFRLKNYEQAKSYYQVAMDMTRARADLHFLQKKIKACDLKLISKN